MALTWVIWAGSTARLREVPALLLLPDEEAPPGGLLKYQRMAKKPTRATARSCGMLIEVSVWAMVAVVYESPFMGVRRVMRRVQVQTRSCS